MAKFASEKQSLSNYTSDLTKKIKSINKQQIKTEENLERLEQCCRRKNLEIYGILFTNNEQTNDIAKNVTNMLKVKLEDKDISTYRRILNDTKFSSGFGQLETHNNSSK